MKMLQIYIPVLLRWYRHDVKYIDDAPLLVSIHRDVAGF